MADQTLLSAWRKYVQAAKKYDWAPLEPVEADIDYLRSINATEALIDAAQYMSGTDEVYWAPTKTKREYVPDCFMGSLCIGEDGAGNYMCWMDVTDPHSKILWLCHDPAVIMVIANSGVEWLEGLVKGYESPTFKEMEESAWGNFMENSGLEETEHKIWKTDYYNGENDELGLQETRDGDTRSFDYTNAQPGAGISLKINGKYTTLEPSHKIGVIKAGKESEKYIRDQKIQSAIIYLFIAILTSGSFFYAQEVLGKGFLASFGFAVVIVLAAAFVFSMLYTVVELLMERFKKPR